MSFDLTYSRKRRRESNDENSTSFKEEPVTHHSAGRSELPGQPKWTAMIEATRILSTLPPGFPTFTKTLSKRSITISCTTYLLIPRCFVGRHLPGVEKTTMTLIDENNKEFSVNYRRGLPGFGSRWNYFVLAHKLRENDVLIFLLIERRKFKVFICRAPHDVDANPTDLVSDSSEAASEDSEQGDLSDNPDTDQSEDLRTYKAFQLKSGSLFSQAGLNENTIKKYYDLCRSKKETLHDQIQSDYNIKLVAGVISELLNIVDGLKSSNACTSRETLEKWQVALDSFEKLGMKVGFVLKKVNDLITLSSDFEVTRYKVEMRKLEIKRAEFTEAVNKVNEEIEVLKSKAAAHKDKVQEVVNSPW